METVKEDLGDGKVRFTGKLDPVEIEWEREEVEVTAEPIGDLEKCPEPITNLMENVIGNCLVCGEQIRLKDEYVNLIEGRRIIHTECIKPKEVE